MITERDFERFQRAGRLLDEARRLHNDAGTALVEVLAESNDPRAHEIATAILARLQRDVLIGSESVAAREHWAGSKPDGTDAPPTRSYPPFSHPPSAPPTDAARPLDSRDTEPDSGWCDSRQIENIDERMAIANMAVEAGADTCVFEYDEQVAQYIAQSGWAARQPVMPDADADYLARHTIDLSALTPLVAAPPSPE